MCRSCFPLCGSWWGFKAALPFMQPTSGPDLPQASGVDEQEWRGHLSTTHAAQWLFLHIIHVKLLISIKYVTGFLLKMVHFFKKIMKTFKKQMSLYSCLLFHLSVRFLRKFLIAFLNLLLNNLLLNICSKCEVLMKRPQHRKQIYKFVSKCCVHNTWHSLFL